MNFDIDYRHVHIVRSPQAVPLLVLVREWGKGQEDAFGNTDVIFLLLRGIQPMANMERGLVCEFLNMTTLYPPTKRFVNDPFPQPLLAGNAGFSRWYH